MPEAIIGPIAGAAVGGLMSDGGSGQTASKEPWSEAAPWLKQLIKDGQSLQVYYQKNPFNAQQQQAYQNVFNDVGNFRSSTAPGLMSFANRLMGTNYQRAPAGTELGGYNHSPRGLLQRPVQQTGQQPVQWGPLTQAMQSLQNGSSPGVFSMPGGQQGGPIDFQSQNPWADILAQREADAAKAPAVTSDGAIMEFLRRNYPDQLASWDSQKQMHIGGA